jgi:hypothetical protein
MYANAGYVGSAGWTLEFLAMDCAVPREPLQAARLWER